MSKKKKAIILSLIVIFAAAILFYFTISKFIIPKKPLEERLIQAFQSKMKPLNTADMNIILFTIDTLRADHLECYGYQGVETPHINQLARE